MPIATSPGRSGFGPQLSLSYDSASGNGPFGFWWSLSLPAITRKTDKGPPQYCDAEESDVYVLSGTEDLVPVLQPDGTRFKDNKSAPGYLIHRYRPRIEGLFARIERWTNLVTGKVHWRSITRENVITLYGKDNSSCIFDPADPFGIHSAQPPIRGWLCPSQRSVMEPTYDVKADGRTSRPTASCRRSKRTRMRASPRWPTLPVTKTFIVAACPH